LNHVPFLTVIGLTVFNVVSVSAQQQQVYGYGIPDSVRYKDSIWSSDSGIVQNYVNLSHFYLEKNPDSSKYWANTAVTAATQKNDWHLLTIALQAQRLTLEHDLKKIKNENIALKKEGELRQRHATLLAGAAILMLVTGIYFAILYRQKSNVAKNLEQVKSETDQKNAELAELQRETKKNNETLLKLQEEAREKNEEFERMNSMKDKLIPMIAHDIRSPLASLQNTLSLTRENVLNPEEFQKLSFALEADIYNLRGMLDNMLLWAREQIVEVKINRSRFDLSEMIRAVILMHRNSLIAKNINVHNYLQPETIVVSDKEMLTAVFRNIFSNAVKFTEPGKNIYIQQIFLKHRIYVSLKDEGKGIPQDILEKINGKQHISTRGTANEKGTGIGIMFSKDLLNKLDEQFDITSMPGKGTSVTFSISINSHAEPGESS
jgi:signal transduction histidine kinase